MTPEQRQVIEKTIQENEKEMGLSCPNKAVLVAMLEHIVHATILLKHIDRLEKEVAEQRLIIHDARSPEEESANREFSRGERSMLQKVKDKIQGTLNRPYAVGIALKTVRVDEDVVRALCEGLLTILKELE